MTKKLWTSLKVVGLIVTLSSTMLFTGCGKNDGKQTKEVAENSKKEYKIDLEDGVYEAEFHTDSTMFHINEAYDGKGILTVKDKEASIHIVLPSKNIVNLFLGQAKDVDTQKENLLNPVVETVKYQDGTTEEANAFDVPVYALDEDFDLALVGTKGKWYDHVVLVTNPVKIEKTGEKLEPGTYDVKVDLEGGSGRASIEYPSQLVVEEDGSMKAVLTWSSNHYDYMLVDGEKYLPTNTEGNSVFEIPLTTIEGPVPVIADTTAMSEPHEISYNLYFTLETKE